jgi:alpha-1,3-glucan synthase
MGDLIGFRGFENASAPFSATEYHAEWRSDRRYLDFSFGDTYNATCNYPRFWDESGFPVTKNSDSNFGQLRGCYNSEFDQVSKLNVRNISWQDN